MMLDFQAGTAVCVLSGDHHTGTGLGKNAEGSHKRRLGHPECEVPKRQEERRMGDPGENSGLRAWGIPARNSSSSGLLLPRREGDKEKSRDCVPRNFDIKWVDREEKHLQRRQGKLAGEVGLCL